MTSGKMSIAITEIDLLAYADGLLDTDPGRKAAVEAFLNEHPCDAERVRAYAAQNQEIRRIYGAVIAEPVPNRLEAVLYRGRRLGTLPVRVAASIALLLAAGMGGWLAGREYTKPVSPIQAFIEQAMTSYSIAQSDAALKPGFDQVSLAGVFHQLSDVVSLELGPPDLSELGYAVAEKRVVAEREQELVQITYARADGRQLILFLRSRWNRHQPTISFVHKDDVAMAYWLDGPLIYGIVAEDDTTEMMSVAAAIQNAVRSNGTGSPRMAIQGELHNNPLEAGLATDSAGVIKPAPPIATPTVRTGLPVRAN